MEPTKEQQDSFEFTVPGKPVPYAREQVPQRRPGGRPVNVLSKSAKAYQELVARHAWAAKFEQEWTAVPPKVPVYMKILMFFAIPKSASAPEQQRRANAYRTATPDCSNVFKNVEDALSHTGGVSGFGAIAFQDDKVVAKGAFEKRDCYAGEERIEVTITVLEQGGRLDA